ncbi:hypothetical protein [Desertibaculum subflavum]|uniref:hypothetical protein n=1 Tax=Desertibaculum subflavum TaxID=2268458 RepID=UPI000E673A20
MIGSRILSVALVALFGAPAASALTLQQVVGDSFSGSFDTVSFASFDPALGTLDRVDVAINGTLVLQGPTQVNFLQTPGGPVPQPVALAATVSQDFFRIGIGNRGFEFGSPAQFFFNGVATGAGEPAIFSRPFSYGFAFTDFTDLLGFAIPSFTGANQPPITVNGQRDDFLDLAPPLDALSIDIAVQTMIAQLTGFAGAAVNAAGSVFVTYTYTTLEVAVAEPATAGLFGCALAGLALLRRRR